MLNVLGEDVAFESKRYSSSARQGRPCATETADTKQVEYIIEVHVLHSLNLSVTLGYTVLYKCMLAFKIQIYL